MALKGKDRLQVAAFHSIYRSLRRADAEFRRSREEDFVEALLATSDVAMRTADPDLMEKWLARYASSRNHRQYGDVVYD